ncbi:MAG: chemotaxis protein CheB [Mariniblastus sp.]
MSTGIHSEDLNDDQGIQSGRPQSVKFVVGVGASAGGIRSIEKLLRPITPHSEAAFVIIQHMSPDADSCMVEILTRYTSMGVVLIEQQMSLEPNTIYLIPPAKEVRLNGHTFEVSALEREQIARPIDTFFRSLAESFGEKAIGMVLSGTGSDGSDGIEMIHRMGGTTIVESIESAQFDGMPRNAIATDCIDLVMLAEEIGEWLNHRFENPVEILGQTGGLASDELTGVQLIFSLLAARHEIDFSLYKTGTVARRIERRQNFQGQNSILDYADFVRGNKEELEALYHDLLIGVTRFFRDSDAFSRLQKELADKIQGLPEGKEFRVWVVGCATGEEAYSIAMLCHEAFTFAGKEPQFKIFATDAHGGSLDHASKGIFQAESLEFVSLDRQQKFFVREPAGVYRVGTDLRKHLVFARHNVIYDPPFTKMDLVTCRNLLIYLQPEAQGKAIASFHFALNRQGIMFMGPSESPGKLLDEFEVIDEAWKIYGKLRDLPTPHRGLSNQQNLQMARPRRLVNLLSSGRPEAMSFTGLVESYDLILREFVDSGLLLDENKNVLHVFGDANKYLKSSSGRFTGNVMGFLDGESKIAITAALLRAKEDIGQQVVLEDLELPCGEDEVETVDVFVKAIEGHSTNPFIWFVAFLAKSDSSAGRAGAEDDTIKVNLSSDAYAAMEAELLYTKENLSTTIDAVETSNEKLQSANEQLLAANEELQSTNEELHSVNEELFSVNAENQRKITELEEVTDDVNNLLANTDIGIIFLDAEMNVRKFTLAAVNYVKLLPSDIGRSITDLAIRVRTPKFYEKISNVIETGEPYAKFEMTNSNVRVLVRVMPYWSHGLIKGAILNFIDMREESNQSKANQSESNHSPDGESRD